MGLPLRALGSYHATAEALREIALSAAIEQYRRHKLMSGRWRPSSDRTFSYVARQIVRVLGDVPVTSIGPEQIEKLWITLSSEGLTPQWLERVRSSVHAFFEYLVKFEAISRNPTVIWEAQEIDEDEHIRVFHDFTKTEIQALVAEAPIALLKFVWTACYTGLRRANICEAMWSWVSPCWILEIPSRKFKQGRKQRVPLHPCLIELLSPRRKPSNPLIPDLPTADYIGDLLKALARKAGIPPEWVYPHNFRRTFCRWFSDAGGTRQEAMEVLGSRSESVLLRHYWPQTPDAKLQDIIRKF